MKGPGLDVGLGEMDVGAKKAKGAAVGVKVEGELKGPGGVEMELKGPRGPDVGLDVGLEGPGLDVKLEGPKMEGNMELKGGSVPSLGCPELRLRPSAAISAPDLNGDSSRSPVLPLDAAGVGAEGLGGTIRLPSLQLPQFGLSAPSLNGADGGGGNSAMLDIHGAHKGGSSMGSVAPMGSAAPKGGGLKDGGGESGSIKVSFPKLRVPKFHFSEAEVKGREVGVDVEFPGSEPGPIEPIEIDESKGKKSKRKMMPKFTFSKGKGKGGTAPGSPEPPSSPLGSKGDLKSSKGSLGSEGDPDESHSPKGMFSIFKGGRKSRLRSSSFSSEPPPSDATEGKPKFGTFGGVGSRSKGCYEVTVGGEETPQDPHHQQPHPAPHQPHPAPQQQHQPPSARGALRLPSLELTAAKRREEEGGCT